MPDGRRVRYAGIVICRQRPATETSVTFMTLEDETGFVNVVVWKRVFDEHAVLARTASFLGVTGKLQSESGVVHITAEAVWTPALRRGRRQPQPAAGIFMTAEQSATSRRSESAGRTSEACRPLTYPTSLVARRANAPWPSRCETAEAIEGERESAPDGEVVQWTHDSVAAGAAGRGCKSWWC